MKDRLTEAFDAVHAGAALENATRAYLARKTRRRHPVVRRLIPAVALLLVLTFGTGCGVYFTPTAVISIDVNPSLDLGINRFDRVVSVRGRNQDGEVLAQSLRVLFLDYRDAVEHILDSDTVTQCLEEGKALSISVTDDDGDRETAMVEDIRSCTAGRDNVYCSGGHHGGTSPATPGGTHGNGSHHGATPTDAGEDGSGGTIAPTAPGGAGTSSTTGHHGNGHHAPPSQGALNGPNGNFSHSGTRFNRSRHGWDD